MEGTNRTMRDFDDLNLKLAVIQALRDLELMAKFDKDAFWQTTFGEPYDPRASYNYEVVAEVVEYYRRLELPRALVAEVKQLGWYAGLSPIIGDLQTHWDGEDDFYSIASLAGIEACTSLEGLEIEDGMHSISDFSPLRSLEKLDLASFPYLSPEVERPAWFSVRIGSRVPDSDKYTFDEAGMLTGFVDPYHRPRGTLAWRVLTERFRFAEGFIRAHLAELDHELVIATQPLTVPLMKIFPDPKILFGVGLNPYLTEELVRTLPAPLASSIVCSTDAPMSEGFLRELAEGFPEKICWYALLENHAVSMAFIEQYLPKFEGDALAWNRLSQHQKLSEDFLRKHADRVDWTWVSSEQTLSESFLRQMHTFIDWRIRAQREDLPEPLRREFLERPQGS